MGFSLIPQSAKLFNICKDFCDDIKQDFAFEAKTSNWFVWYEIEDYFCNIGEIHIGVKKTNLAIDYMQGSTDGFEDNESEIVNRIIEYHQKNTFSKLRELGWCSEYNERHCFGLFEFVWCSHNSSFDGVIKKCNCKKCIDRFLV